MEILSQNQIFEQVGGWPPIAVAMTFIVIFIASAWFFAVVLDLEDLGFLCGVILTLVTLFTSMSLWAPKDTPTGRYEYKVILDESYSATDLYEEFEVVSQEGKIWIIQDKEP